MPSLRTFTAVLVSLLGAWTGLPARASAQGIDLQQGWDEKQSAGFWFKSQGSRIMLYSWFIGLEQEKSGSLLIDPPFLEGLGFIRVDGYKLPIGFAQDENQQKTATYLGLTCAACHTSRLEIEGKPIIVDGGPTLADFSGFLDALVGSTSATLNDDAKFARFAKRVKAENELASLRKRLDHLNRALTARRDQNAPDEPYGYGRVDAFGHIFNRVFSTAIKVEDNRAKADAPVSYPFLWDTSYPYHERVQWNASAPNRPPGDLARNIGELLGVFGYFDLRDFGPLGYRKSSVRVLKLIALERLVKDLRSPVWPAGLSGNMKIDAGLAEKGSGVYGRTCERCHHRMDRADGRRRANEKLVPLDVVGTDPTMADNHARRLSEQSLKTGLLKGRPKSPGNLSLFGDSASGAEILGHVLAWVTLGQSVPDDKTSAQPLGQPPPPPPLQVAAKPQKGYKARPLNGVWATAPFLHNGSVPNLRELLNKDRIQGFWVGSNTFDPRNIGRSTEKTAHSSWFDATKDGNRNTGHQFGVDLSPEEKEALLEYLKTL